MQPPYFSIFIYLISGYVITAALPTLKPDIPATLDVSTIPSSINSLEQEHIQRAMVDVVATIFEVQKILETDPNLPRLTRGEIEELFENVTREELDKSLRNGDRDRARHMKALMLVLPYSTNNISDARLQELYTRPPITKVISTEKKIKKPQQIIVSAENMNENKKLNPTTYNLKIQKPTTFHPRSPIVSVPITQAPQIHLQNIEKNNSNNYLAIDRPTHPNLPQRVPIRENVKDLLATIGLTQEILPTTTTQKPELTPEIRQLLESFGLLTNEEPPKHLQFNKNQQSEPEVLQPIPSHLIRNEPLGIELQAPTIVATIPPQAISTSILLKQPTATLKRSSYRMNTAPEVMSNDFYAFKPLRIEDDTQVTSEMQDFLRSYGLLNEHTRGKKSMNKETTPTIISETTTTASPEPIKIMKIEQMPPVSVDFLTSDLLGVLGKIGIQNRAFDTASISNQKERDSRKLKSSTKFEQNTINADDGKKLNLLLDTIKHLEYINANLTDQQLEVFYQNLASLDPLKKEENLGAIKNEIKRQSNKTTLPFSTPSPITTTENSKPLRITLDLKATTEDGDISDLDANNRSLSLFPQEPIKSIEENDISPRAKLETSSMPLIEAASTTTTDEPQNNLNLEESFSGELDPIPDTPLPSQRRNGFYFLADWNSFLEVGESPDKIIVRFDPKIGDPSRFIPVHIP